MCGEARCGHGGAKFKVDFDLPALLASLPARCLGISGLSSNLASQVFMGKKSVAQLPSRTSTHFGFALSL